MNLSVKRDGSDWVDFFKLYNKTLYTLQADISQMEPSPVISVAAEAIAKITRIEQATH